MSSRGRFKNKRGGAAAAGKSSRVKRSTGADVGEEREGMWAEVNKHLIQMVKR